MRLLLKALALGVLLSGCVVTYPATYRVVYTSFGEANPAGDRRVVDAYWTAVGANQDQGTALARRERIRAGAKKDVDPLAGVKVLVDSLPEGMDVRDGRLRVEDPALHQVLGRMEISTAGGMSREKLVGEAKRLAIVAGGNLVILSFGASWDQDHASGAVAIVLKSDLGKLDPSRARMGKVPLEI